MKYATTVPGRNRSNEGDAMSTAADARSSKVDGASILASQGLLPSDDYSLAPSTKAFDDGGKYRLEISGVERLSTLEALLDESDKQGVFIHRIIAFGGGTTLLSTGELGDVAVLAAENGIE